MYYQGRLKDKKLILILDLDYTLLNSARIDQLTSDEQYLLVKLDKERGKTCMKYFAQQIEILCCATLRVTDIMKLNVIKIRFM